MRQKYLLSLIDQGLLSAFNFTIALILIRTWDPALFGVFVFWQAIALFVGSIQNTLVSIPLSVHVPTCRSNLERDRTERALSSLNFLIIAGAFTLVITYNYFFPTAETASFVVTLVFAAYVGASLFREYVRSIGFGRLRPGSVLLTDGPYVLIGCGIFVIYRIDVTLLDLSVVMGILALASAAGGAIGLTHQGQSIRSLRGFTFRIYEPIWRDAKWSLSGAMTTMLQNRGYVFLVTALVGFEALGSLAAGGILFRPVGVLLTAWGRIARPYLARAAAENRQSDFIRTILIALTLTILALLALYAIIYLAWNDLEGLIYRSKYPTIGWIALGWSAVTLVSSLRMVLTITLSAVKQFKPLAIATLYGSIVSLAAVAFTVPIFGFETAMVGIFLGELLCLLYILPRAVRKIEALRSK